MARYYTQDERELIHAAVDAALSGTLAFEGDSHHLILEAFNHLQKEAAVAFIVMNEARQRNTPPSEEEDDEVSLAGASA